MFIGLFIQGDFCEEETIRKILESFDDRKPNLIISDMLMNTCGHKLTDHLRSMELLRTVYSFSLSHLAVGGQFLCKVLQGGTLNEFIQDIRMEGFSVKLVKPNASRSESSEIYLLVKHI